MTAMDIQAAQATPAAATTAPASHFWAGRSFSFHDVLDAINPLQHLPIVATLYRHMTGDKIGNAARVVGDTLYGGPIGLAMSLVNVLEVEKTGTDLGDHVLAMVEGDKSKPTKTAAPAATMLAATSPQQPASSAAPGSATPASVYPSSVSGAAWAPGSAGPIPLGPAGASSSATLAARSSQQPIDLPSFPDTGPASAVSALSTPMPPVPLPTAPRPAVVPHVGGYAIDTSPAGIAAMRARSAPASGAPLQLPAGVMLTNQPQPLASAATGSDFVLKMKQGLAKYQALLAEQAAHHPLAAQPSS
jgi:hypothetical protein